MKIKRLISLLLLIVIVVAIFIPIPLGFIKDDIAKVAKKKGFRLEISKISTKLNGRVTITGLKLFDRDANSVVVKNVEIKSSLLKLNSLRKKIKNKNMSNSDFEALLKSKIKTVKVKNANISSKDSLWLLSGVDVKIGFANENIDIYVKNGQFNQLVIDNLKLNLQRNDSIIKLKSLKCEVAGGNITAQGSINQVSRTAEDYSCTFKNLNISQILSSPKVAGTVSGKVKGSSFKLDSMVAFASGEVVVKDFSQDNYSYFTPLSKAFRLMGVNSLNFDKVTFPFKAEGIWLNTDGFKAERKYLEITGAGKGRISDSYFNYKVNGLLAPEMKDDVKRVIWNALTPLDDGSKTFGASVRGVPNSYVVAINKSLMKRSVNSFFNSLFN